MQAYSPLGHGTLAGNEVCASIGKEHGKTGAQVRYPVDLTSCVVFVVFECSFMSVTAINVDRSLGRNEVDYSIPVRRHRHFDSFQFDVVLVRRRGHLQLDPVG